MLIISDLKLLATGPAVRSLHDALRVAGHPVREGDAEKAHFGLATRAALLAFQSQHGLKETGIADAPTRALLERGNDAVDQRKPRLPPYERAFAETPKLRAGPKALIGSAGGAGALIEKAMVADLKARVVDMFPEPSDAVVEAINALELPLEDVLDLTLERLIETRIVPELLRDPDLQDELFDRTRAPDNEEQTVGELLGADKDIRDTSRFSELVNRARNESFSEILEFSDTVRAAIGGLDLARDQSDLKSLIDTGRLTQGEAERLRVLSGIARLTDDDFDVVRAVSRAGLDTPRALVVRSVTDWMDLLEQAGRAGEDDDSLEDFAKLIDEGVEKAFPSEYALARFTTGDSEETLARVDLLSRIPLGDAPIFADGKVRSDLDLSGFGNEAEDMRRDLDALAVFSARYAALGIADILNDATQPAQSKREGITRRMNALRRFWDETPNLDLSRANFTPLNNPATAVFSVFFDALDAEDREPVRQAIMALQRTHHLTDRHSEADALLANGLDTARKIAATGSVSRLAERTGLEEAVALRIRAHAVERAAHMVHVVNAIEAIGGHARFEPGILQPEAGAANSELVNVLRGLPGYADLFGPQNYCKCEHCQSMLSPAAYFVDLMCFIDREISAPTFVDEGLTDHPLYLRNRRSDLWSLPLTCENTDTLVIYLVIVNEILEAFLEDVSPIGTDVFEFLATDARSSFRQPFNAPFAELLLYLEYLGLDLSALSALFDGNGQPAPYAMLKISPEELATIAAPDLDATRFRFANLFPEDLAVHDVARMVRAMGIDRDMLDRYLAVDFVAGDMGVEIEMTTASGDATDLTGFVERLHLDAPAHAVTEQSLRNFLDRLHRFVRLHMALGWTAEEASLVLETFASPPPEAPATPEAFGQRLDETLLAQFASFKRLMHVLDLSVSDAIALCDRIPETPPAPDGQSLRAQLVGDQETFELRHPALESADAGDPGVSPDFGVIQGALGLSDPNLIATLRFVLTPAQLAEGTIDSDTFDALYRTARLARALDLRPFQLEQLSRAIPAIAGEADAATRLAALIKIASILEQQPDLAALLDHLPDSAAADAREEVARAHLDAIRDSLRLDERVMLGPADLAGIEGTSQESALGILDHLSSLDAPWLRPLDEDPQRFRLTDEVAQIPDLDVIRAAVADSLPVLQDDPIIETVAKSLSALLSARHPSPVLGQAIRDTLGLSEAMAEALRLLLAPDISTEDQSSDIAAWLAEEEEVPEALFRYCAELMRVAALFVETINADETGVEFVARHAEHFNLMPGSDWELDALLNVSWFVRARGKPAAGAPLHLDQALDGWFASGVSETVIAQVAAHHDVDAAVVSGMIDELPVVALSPGAAALATLMRLDLGLRVIARSGLDALSLRQLTADTYDGLVAARGIALGAMRTKHSDDTEWRAVQEPFIEKRENLKRDALVDRILSRPAMGFATARDIYHFFLLDPEMDGCFRTSRVAAAISSCQLYVQRCLMGLERSVETDTDDALQVSFESPHKARREWEWRKFYRVWEANRKVFLYPENYMLPELYTGGSHILKGAVRDLLQANLDETTIEKAFQRYLDEFQAVGNLEYVDALYDKSTDQYLFVGRTQTEPFRYFTRHMEKSGRWQPWDPIDLDIGARSASAVIKQSKLHLFWTGIDLQADADKVRGAMPDTPADTDAEDNDQSREVMPVTVTYSIRDARGQWTQPQDILFYNLLLRSDGSTKHALLDISEDIYAEYPHPSGSTSSSGNSGVTGFIRLVHPVQRYGNPSISLRQVLGFLREWDGQTVKRNGQVTGPAGHSGNFNDQNSYRTPGFFLFGGALHLGFDRKTGNTAELEHVMNYPPAPSDISFDDKVLEFIQTDERRLRLRTVQHKTSEAVFQTGRGQYLIKRTGQDGSDIAMPSFGPELTEALAEAKWKLVNLDSTWPKTLLQAFHKDGLNGVLNPSMQATTMPRTWDMITYQWLGQIKWADEDLLAQQDHVVAQFSGPHGQYLWEIFFHMPFLIANTLNAAGKFEEADRWYRRIFDPTSGDADTNAHWRFTVFRTLKQPRLREILTQTKAVKAYKRKPFEPFAIADLRPSAYQKTIVMRYIDNLLDWGDEKFRQFTAETVNEALLLYIMAADLLGERPVETGECPVADSMTYTDILIRGTGNEFLIELENIIAFFVAFIDVTPISPTIPDLEFVPFERPTTDPVEPVGPILPGAGFRTSTIAPHRIQPMASLLAARDEAVDMLALGARRENTTVPLFPGVGNSLTIEREEPEPRPPFQPTGDAAGSLTFEIEDSDPSEPIGDARQLGFCVPPNDVLLGYWDRVEDRLHKIRHCMTIDGIKSQLPLWQPVIDPMLLVRAKAAGLDLATVIASLNEQPQPHRFDILLEQARRFASAAQQLGGQLLSALERKDESELAELRAVHEDTILSLSRDQRRRAVDDAREALQQVGKIEAAIQTRIDHYTDLLAGSFEFGMNAEEQTAIDEMSAAMDRDDAAAAAESKAQRYRELGPQWSAGLTGDLGFRRDPSFNGPRWGFYLAPMSQMTASTVWGSVNIEARFQRRAFRHRSASARHNAASALSSVRAGHKRRQHDWKHQLVLARAEMAEMAHRRAITDIQLAIAERDLDVHDRQIEHAREIHDFISGRFTGLGLYTYLSSSLSQLYRQSYDLAFRAARTAERAYQFEIGEAKHFLKADNWSASRAGLLAAEKLQHQLNQMEASYSELDRRRQEITLSCSLALIDPDAVVRLRREGTAEFTLPAWFFDLMYPGQYRHRIEWIRLAIPSVVGPYANVGARLTLLDSAMRMSPSLDPSAIQGITIGRNSFITTSSADSDPGLFDLNLDGPKHPPFRGAGAVSNWRIELPRRNHVFPYPSITDVIPVVGFSAQYDDTLRTAVEGSPEENGVVEAMLGEGHPRILSLRREFPDAYHRLVTQPDPTGGGVTITIARQHLLHWMSGHDVVIDALDVAFEPRENRGIEIADLQGAVTVTVNGNATSNWSLSPSHGLPRASPGIAAAPLDSAWTIDIDLSGVPDLPLGDVLLRFVVSLG